MADAVVRSPTTRPMPAAANVGATAFLPNSSPCVVTDKRPGTGTKAVRVTAQAFGPRNFSWWYNLELDFTFNGPRASKDEVPRLLARQAGNPAYELLVDDSGAADQSACGRDDLAFFDHDLLAAPQFVDKDLDFLASRANAGEPSTLRQHWQQTTAQLKLRNAVTMPPVRRRPRHQHAARN